MRRPSYGLVAAILLVATLAPGTGAANAASTRKGSRDVDVGVRHVSLSGKDVPLLRQQARRLVDQEAQSSQRAQAQASAVGDEKFWLAIDFVGGFLYLKEYTLRGLGNNSEVWVASDSDDVSTDTDFPDGDCRNGERTEITDEQVDYLIDQFDNNILPKESDTFSVAPDIDGSNAVLPGLVGLPADYYEGDGDKTVVLVDNVRDENFYDTNNQHTFSYVAGFFSSAYGFYLDRNAMTIDAFDWLHRTGANPPHEPTTDPCSSAPARPFLYEGVFAHEYQHLLESYEDPAETTWVNEGLSDWAQTLTGYVDPSIPITDLGSDSHVQCFLGHLGEQTEFNPIPRDGGPENSLNLWGDQTDFEWEILCDYGAAYSAMLLLADRFGPDFMGDLHRDDLQGFESLESLMQAEGSGMSSSEVIDTWASMVALDGILDDGANLKGGTEADFQVSTLDATINWDTEQAYSSPGAPPNGSDYVRLRDGSGYLSAGQINRISFDGVNELPPLPPEWTIDPNPPGQAGDPALYSTDADSRNAVIVQEVNVPPGSPELTFDAAWDLETTFDFAYVQITTDGGETYTSLRCTDTVDDTDPDLGNVGPGFGQGFNGFDETPTFQPQACDLTPYAGSTVGLAFRYFSDSNTHGAGFWADDVMIDGELVSDGSTLGGWLSGTEYNPVEVEGYTVRLIAYGNGQKAWIADVPLDENLNGELTGGALRTRIGFRADTVAAIVTYHDSTEEVLQYAPYILRVNDVRQPGGS
jgi:hypothetical protein